MKNEMNQAQAVKNGWIQTYTGMRVYPIAPVPHQFLLEDIAHALAMQCRWNGHTRTFFSVAQHCVLASELSVEYARELLMHDATEAYISDVPRPVKRQLPEFQHYEERLMEVIFEAFNLRYPLAPEVHAIDNVLLRWEARDLFSPGRCVSLFGEAAAEGIRHLRPIVPWSPPVAEEMFIARANKLGIVDPAI